MAWKFAILAWCQIFFLGACAALAQTSIDLQPTTELPTEILGSSQLRPVSDRSVGYNVAQISEMPESIGLSIKLIDLKGNIAMIEATDAFGQPLLGVPMVRHIVPDRERDIWVVDVKSAFGTDDIPEGHYLRLTIGTSFRQPKLRLYFPISKVWSRPPVVVRPQPVGAAVALLASIRGASSRLPDRTIKLDPGAAVSLDPSVTLTQKALDRLELNPAITPRIRPDLDGVIFQPDLTLPRTEFFIQPQITFVPVAPDTTVARVADSQMIATVRTDTAQSEHVGTINKDLIERLPTSTLDLQIVKPERFIVAVPDATEETSTVPSNLVGSSGPAIFSIVQTEPGVDVSLSDVLGIESAILPDQNAASGIYYYIPAEYQLAYDRDLGGSRGLALRIDYDAMSEDAETAPVRIAMTLQAPLDGNGIAITQELMRKYAELRPEVTFTELRPLPMASVPEFLFGDTLAGAVDEDDIAVTAFSDFLEGLQVSWFTDPVRAERIRRDLSSEIAGLTGIARFALPSAGAPQLRDVPAQVRLSDPSLYKAILFDRSGRLTNSSPLPIRVKWLHALVLSDDGGPRIYSWSLDQTSVAPGSDIVLDLANFPAKLDQIADRIWIDYGLDPACQDCLTEIVASVLDGGVWPDTETVEFDALPSLFADGTVEVEVEMRSAFFDPTDRSVRSAPPFYLTPDASSHAIGPIFADSTTNEVLFEYRLSLLSETGEFLTGEVWLPQTRTRVRPGLFQLNQSLDISTDGGE